MDVLRSVGGNLWVLAKFLVDRFDEYGGDEEDDVKDGRQEDLSVAIHCAESQITLTV